MKLLFWGTPEEAVPFLESCAREHEVLAAVTRPDRPAGRGLEFQASPVKQAAERLKIPVFQPAKPSELIPEIKNLKPEMSVVVAYGKILKKEVLDSVQLGFMNVHFSLLPKYRGAAPMEWSLIRGETKTGITLFWLDEGMDTGPVQSRSEIDVSLEEDAESLAAKLVQLGVKALGKALSDVAQGRVHREPQVGESSLAPKLTRADAKLDFAQPALELHNRVRGLKNGPRAFIQLKSGAVAILKTSLDNLIAPSTLGGEGAGEGRAPSRNPHPDPLPSRARETATKPGSVVRVERNRGVLVQCTQGRIWIAEVQPEGKRQIQAADFINGLRLRPGDSFPFL